MKSPPNHMQALFDGVSLMSWPFLQAGDAVKDMMKEYVDQVTFYGNRVLKLDKQLDTAWYDSYKKLYLAHYNFVVERYETISEWTGKENA